MSKTINTVTESFRLEMRIFELYHQDTQKNLTSLNNQVLDFEKYLKDGGSIAVKSNAFTKPGGRKVMTMGVVDTPESREIVAFATENRLKQTREYLDISLTMALSHLITIFDAKFLDLIGIYYEANPSKLEPDVTLERKLMNFAYKPFKNQVASISQNLRINLTKLLGNAMIDSLIEIRETRNVIVHNSGLIGESYLIKVNDPQFNIGDKRPITADYFETAVGQYEHFFYEFSRQLSSIVR